MNFARKERDGEDNRIILFLVWRRLRPVDDPRKSKIWSAITTNNRSFEPKKRSIDRSINKYWGGWGTWDERGRDKARQEEEESRNEESIRRHFDRDRERKRVFFYLYFECRGVIFLPCSLGQATEESRQRLVNGETFKIVHYVLYNYEKWSTNTGTLERHTFVSWEVTSCKWSSLAVMHFFFLSCK